MQVGETFIKVRPDTDGFGQELEQGVQRSTTSLGQALTAGAAVAGFQRLIDASSDLNESVNVTGLVFNESQAEIDAFAQGAAQSIGQSERAAREATATFGGLLQNVGFLEPQAADTSIALTRLASDLGSAFNRDPEEAVVALTSALRGETEPIRAFNVQLDDMSVRQEAVRLGLAATTAEVDQQGLVQGRLSLITQQTARVQGDFANTSTEAANAQRIAAAEAENSAAQMGSNFLPAYKGGLAVVQAVTRGFGAMPGPIQTAIVALGLVAATKGPVGNALGSIGDSVANLRGRVAEGGGGLRGFSAQITGSQVAAVGAVAGLTALTVALGAQAEQAEETERRIQTLGEAYQESGRSGLTESVLAQIREDAPDALAALDDAGVAIRDIVDAFASGDGEAARRLFEPINDIIADIGATDPGQAEDLIAIFESIVPGIESAAQAEEQLEQNTTATTGSLRDQAERLTEVADAADGARDQLEALFGIQQGLDEANVEVQASIDDLRASLRDTPRALREQGRAFDISTEAGRRNLGAAREAASAIREQTIAARASGQSADQAAAGNRFLTEALRRQLLAAGLSRRETDNLINTYGRVPRNVLTSLSVTASTSGLSTLTAELRRVAEAYNQVEVNRGAALQSIGGGPRSAADLDKGPTPRSGGRSRDGGGGGGPTIIIQAPLATVEALERVVIPRVMLELDRIERRRDR